MKRYIYLVLFRNINNISIPFGNMFEFPDIRVSLSKCIAVVVANVKSFYYS